MRHIYAHRIFYLLAALILGACALFAWIRSEDITIVPRKSLPAPAGVTRGADVYAQGCRGCHARLPHLAELARAQAGRNYLVSLLLFGLDGRITLRGAQHHVFHPPFDRFSDDDLASTLNYTLSQWGNDAVLPADWKPYDAAEVAAARARPKTMDEVRAQRPALNVP